MTAPLHHLFTLPLKEGVVPSDWKRHNIIPVFKSGDKSTIKTIAPFLFCVMYQKFWNGCYTIEFLISIQTLFHAINLDFETTNLLFNNCYCISMICVQTESKLTALTLTLVKHSTVFRMLNC